MSRKFVAGQNPVEQEAEVAVIEPTSEEMARELNRMVDLMYRNATPSQRKALDFWKLHHATTAATTEVKLMFLRRFYFWLLGRGTKEDHAKTLWGRGNVAVINAEVREYIEQFAKKRLEFALLLATMQNRVPDTLNGYYLYFKYIVNGGLKRSKAADGSTFWDMSNENFLKDFEMMEQTFSAAGKPTYSDVIRPAAEKPPKEPGFGWAKNELQEAPYPAGRSDREKWAFNADGLEEQRAAHRARQAGGLDDGGGAPPPPPPPASGGGGGIPPAEPPFQPDPMEDDTEPDDESPATGAEAAAVNVQLRAEIDALLADRQRAAANIGDLREAIRRYEVEDRAEREKLEKQAEQAFKAQEAERRRLGAEVERLSAALRSRDDRPPGDGGAAVAAAVESARDQMAEQMRAEMAKMRHDFEENRERMAREGRQALAAKDEEARARLVEEATRWEEQFRRANEAASRAAAEHQTATANAAARMAQMEETNAALHRQLHEMGVNFENAQRVAAASRRDDPPPPPTPEAVPVHVAQHHEPEEAVVHQRVERRAKKAETVLDKVSRSVSKKPSALSDLRANRMDRLRDRSRAMRGETRRNRRAHADSIGEASRGNHNLQTAQFVYEHAETNDDFTRAYEEEQRANFAAQAKAQAAAREAARVEQENLRAAELARREAARVADDLAGHIAEQHAIAEEGNAAMDESLERLAEQAAQEALEQEQQEATRKLLADQEMETEMAEEAKRHEDALKQRDAAREAEIKAYWEAQERTRQNWEALAQELANDDFVPPQNVPVAPVPPASNDLPVLTQEEIQQWASLLGARKKTKRSLDAVRDAREVLKNVQESIAEEEVFMDEERPSVREDDDEGTEEEDEGVFKGKVGTPAVQVRVATTKEGMDKRFYAMIDQSAAKRAERLAEKRGLKNPDKVVKDFQHTLRKVLASNN